jgi:hypothetical protein
VADVNLGTGLGTVLLGEEDVIVLAGVEGRVEIDEVHRLIFYIPLEDFEIVTVVELVFLGRHGIGMRLTQRTAEMKGGLRIVDSPVPKSEGPGAPSTWFENIIGTGATRRVEVCGFPGLRIETWGTRRLRLRKSGTAGLIEVRGIPPLRQKKRRKDGAPS